MQIPGLNYEGEITWQEVFQAWKEREGNREEWQKVAQEKGWQSWEEWRSAWVANFQAKDRQWFRYRILDPLKTVPTFRIGPTQSWQKNFPQSERNQHTFAALVDQVSYDKNSKVIGILENFPQPTEFIGIYLPDKTIVNIEGHHRATALALAAKEAKQLTFTQLPIIALTIFQEGEDQLLTTMLVRGSKKNP